MPNINEIDYDYLAHIAETSRVPFHVLCQRAEKGQPLENQVREDPMEWVGYHMAAILLGVQYMTLASRFVSKEAELDYWGIEWKSRSKINPTAKRGCGVLFKRADIIVLNNIKVGAHISLQAALKVFQAMELGKI